MFINCPNCSGLVATDLATNRPPERCPRCGFGPLADPADPAPQPQPPPAEPETEADGADPVDDPPPADPDPDPEPTPALPPAPSPEQTAPRFLHRRGPPVAGWRPVAIAAGLAVLLAGQLVLAERSRLAADARWRPLLTTLCGTLGCSLPPWREPAAIALQQRDVRPLPDRPGVLRVSASIRNDARWPQAWPRLVLTLSDIDGRALGVRAFDPAEYLAAAPAGPTLGSGDGAEVRIDIVEPSPHAVAFDFRFD